MKRFLALVILLVMVGIVLIAIVDSSKAAALLLADRPKLTDADKLTLTIAHRDFLSALAIRDQQNTQCKTQADQLTQVAIAKRDALQKIINGLDKPGFVLNLDKLIYEDKKPDAAKN